MIRIITGWNQRCQGFKICLSLDLDWSWREFIRKVAAIILMTQKDDQHQPACEPTIIDMFDIPFFYTTEHTNRCGAAKALKKPHDDETKSTRSNHGHNICKKLNDSCTYGSKPLHVKIANSFEYRPGYDCGTFNCINIKIVDGHFPPKWINGSLVVPSGYLNQDAAEEIWGCVEKECCPSEG